METPSASHLAKVCLKLMSKTPVRVIGGGGGSSEVRGQERRSCLQELPDVSDLLSFSRGLTLFEAFRVWTHRVAQVLFSNV